jgi:uncharacterized protein (UPF0548 family)
MFFFTKPATDHIYRILAAEATKEWNYPQVGMTRRDEALNAADYPGYALDRWRVKLGEGRETFDRAVAALRRWEEFRLGWTELCFPDAPLEPTQTVGVLAHVGLWTLNACRIIYTIDEQNATTRFGFAYGTLPGHVEMGEERFLLEWSPIDGAVWYEILAISKPRHLLARLAFPLARHLQARFRRDSAAAMRRAVMAPEMSIR